MKGRLALAGLCLAACSESAPQLIADDLIKGDTIPEPLSPEPGDAIRGERIFVDRDKGHCVLCHQIDGLSAPFQGDLGPTLTHVADRLDAGQLRLRIVDYQILQPGTVMPSYYRIHALNQVQEAYKGETILSAQDVDDLVVYLSERKANEHAE